MHPEPDAPARIAYVRYLNTRPLVEGLQAAHGVRLIAAAPSHIADLVREGEADVGLASIVDAVRHPDLAALPAGMIGCDGPTMTVRLFSARPLDQIDRLHADVESHTSVALCLLLLQRLHGVAPEVVPFDARERVTAEGPAEWPDAMLLIGDKVVNDSPPAVRYPHQLDLGEAWRDLTGLPFVYATWLCRADEADSPRIAALAALLDRQLRHNLTRLDWIIQTRAPEHRWPTDLAASYLRGLLRYTIGPRERHAAERFLADAADLGLLPDRPLRWADWRTALAATA